ICKNRDLGVQDIFAESYFDQPSKLFLNHMDEYRHYGWEPEQEEWTGETPFDNGKYDDGGKAAEAEEDQGDRLEASV
ncbi:hypothetical protein, partial [Christensenella minuta]